MFHQHLCLCLSGESGLGKSTLINSLFLTDLYSPEYPGPSHRIKKTVQVTFFTSLCHVFCHVALHITHLDVLHMVRLYHMHGCDTVTRLRQVKFKCSSSEFNRFVSFFCRSFCFGPPQQTFTTNLHDVAFYISSRSRDALYGTFLWIECVLFKHLKITIHWNSYFLAEKKHPFDGTQNDLMNRFDWKLNY